jgi:cell division protein WhiA
MLLSSEIKGELARVHPVRLCCRRAQLAGLLFGDSASPEGDLRTLDHATARNAVHLATSLGRDVSQLPRASLDSGQGTARGGRHHLQLRLGPDIAAGWSWSTARPCDRRAFLRGLVLGCGSITLRGPHVEFVFRERARAGELMRRLREVEVRARVGLRRSRWVVYVKGQEEVATLLRLTGANRGLLDFETGRVGRDVRNRLNRLINAEQANVDRTVRAADRQLQAIARLEEDGRLSRLSSGLREAAQQRRAQPDADLDTLSAALGLSRSAVNHRLRRLVELAEEETRLPHAAAGGR